jgi:hypothetical protein
MRTIRVVLDTNVVVSAHLNSEGYERGVLDLALAGKLRMFVSEAILREYESVLRRPKFRLKSASVSHSLLLVTVCGEGRGSLWPNRCGSRSRRQPLSGMRGSREGGLSGHRQQTTFSQAVATDFDRECAGVVGVDDSGNAVMGD